MSNFKNNKVRDLIRITCAFALIIPQFLVLCQQDDPVLFLIDDNPVQTSEFLYIYNKNNPGTNDLNNSSVREYLDLYKNFKLKVHHARQLKMDTIVRLTTELAGYREQLASTYLSDNSVMGRLAAEAYDRMKQEAEVSHILIKLERNPSYTDTLQAYRQASKIYRDIMDGTMDFGESAKQFSQDKKNKELGGYIGYIKAILPKGYYSLESVIYNLTPGNISNPVRSPRGYHLIKLHSFRVARPEVEIAHIFVKKNKKSDDQSEAERKINDMHHRLTRGVSFEEMAVKESQDDSNARKGGRIGFLKTGQYEPEFENAAHALTEDGQISEPVETRVGFHIIKRLGVKEQQSFNDSRRRLENTLRRTEREELARKAMIDRIMTEENLVIDQANKNAMFNLVSKEFFSYQWKKPNVPQDQTLLSFGNGITKTTDDFLIYLVKHPKERNRLKSRKRGHALTTLFDNYISEVCLELEKSQLEMKHPEFAALMREYEEGILLFEITKENVWDRASSDTVGLRQYFNSHKSAYNYPEQLEVTTYTISNSSTKKAKKIAKQIKKQDNDALKLAYPNMPQENKAIDRTDKNQGQYAWKKGKLSKLKPLGNSGTAFTISKTMNLIPQKPKALEECRGYVIADFQEELEKNWIVELRKLYRVKEHPDAVAKIIN